MEVIKVLNLTKLAQYLEVSGLSTTLTDEQGPFTIFAPSDDAFENLPEPVIQSLRDDPAKLQGVLGYHVISERKWTYEFGKDNLVNTISEPNKLRLNTFRFGKVGQGFRKMTKGCGLLLHDLGGLFSSPRKNTRGI